MGEIMNKILTIIFLISMFVAGFIAKDSFDNWKRDNKNYQELHADCSHFLYVCEQNLFLCNTDLFATKAIQEEKL